MAKPVYLTQEAYEKLIDSGQNFKDMQVVNEEELIRNMFARHWEKELAGLTPAEITKLFYKKMLELQRKLRRLR